MSGSRIKAAVRDWKKSTVILLIIISNVILLVAHLSPTSEVDATVPITTPLGKTTEAGLQGSLYLYGFDVEAGVKGGIIEGGIKVKNERFFMQGPGPELPERLGIIMNSYENRGYDLVARTKFDIHAGYNGKDYGCKIEVVSHIDRVPFWVDGVEEKMSITVSLNDTWNVSRVDVSRVWVEIWTDYDEDENEYTSKKIIWERDVDDVLENTEDELKYSLDLKYQSSQKRMGIVTRIECSMTDVDGNVDENPSTPFSSDKYPHPHNVYLVTHAQGGKVLLMVAAFPMFLVAAILSIIGIMLIIKDNRKAPKYILAAGILVALGMFFYWWGVMTILGMAEVSSTLELLTSTYFSWNWSFYLLIPSSCLLISSSIFIWLGKVVPGDKRADPKGMDESIDEENEAREEREGLAKGEKRKEEKRREKSGSMINDQR